MAKPRKIRPWDQLAESTRKRYIAKGKRLGLSPAQVQAHHAAGQPMGAFRGHAPKPGASERQWGAMLAAAKAARLHEDVDYPISVILESLLVKGYKPEWIIRKLVEKKESRDTYRSKTAHQLRKSGDKRGWDPGRPRYFTRDIRADIEIFWYH